MKIGVLTHNFPRFPGDFSGSFVEALCREYVRQGAEVTVVAPFDPAYRRAAADLGGVRLHTYRYVWPDSAHRLGYMRTMRADLAMKGEAYLLGALLLTLGKAAVERWIAQAQPDVLHAHWVLPNGYLAAGAAARRGIPLVVSIPGSDALVAGQNPLFKRMARQAFATAGLITANSADLREVAVRDLGADPAKFELIIYGVDPQALRPDPEAGAALRQRLGLAADSFVLLGVGRMVPKKGFDSIIQAMPLFSGAHGDTPLPQRVDLVLVGDGDTRATWEALARALGVEANVHFVGSVPYNQMGAFYNLADVFVMPSVTQPVDGLNVCVLDAMACAKPIVATVVAGNPLVVTDGENGFLVQERSPGSLAAAVTRLVEQPALRLALGARSRQRIEQEFAWQHLARRYLAHFERLVENAKR